MSQFKRYAIHELSKNLAMVAMGRIKADFVVKNAQLVNVNTAEILPNTDVACYKGRIAYVGKNADHCIGDNTKVMDIENKFLSPSFLDGHIHIESSMITVHEYIKAVLIHGTTGVFMDPHEIANVLGIKGIKAMMEDGENMPFELWTTMPSCVPAVPIFEDAGTEFKTNDIAECMQWDRIIGLGEMMNFPAVINGDSTVHDILAATSLNNKVITGHYSHPDIDRGLNAYIASGIISCHEGVSKEDALTRARLGMYANIREGSAWHDLKECSRAITEEKVDTRFFTLVSDDTHPDTLISQGHLDYIIRRAIEEGIEPITAIQMATINCATSFNKQADLGSISPSRFADMVVFSDLKKIDIEEVIFNGVHVASKGKILVELEKKEYPEWAKNTMNIAKPLTLSDMKISPPSHYSEKTIKTHIIQIKESSVLTKAAQADLPIINNKVHADIEQNIAKILVFERHKKTGTRGAGFVKGFHFKRGAVASTVAHDSHNLMIVGVNDEDMLLAGQTLVECGGGMVVVLDKQVLALNPLDIAGLMSSDPIEIVAQRVKELAQSWKALGCDLSSPFMTMALLGLACISELRLTNRGLIDTLSFEHKKLFV